MYKNQQSIPRTFLISVILFFLSAFTVVESKPTARVINGNPALIKDFPWMVYLFINNADGSGKRECGGSLIDKQWILTAAHCFLNEGDTDIDLNFGRYVSVLLNSNKLTPTDKESKIIKSSFVITHPRFNPETLEFDMALLKLSEPVTIEPIALLSADKHNFPTVGSKATILGWGATRLSDRNTAIRFSNDLLKADQGIVSSEFCKSSYGGENFIANEMICANGLTSTDKTDTCIGDSGGPMVIEQNGHFVQVGVTSFGGGQGVLCGSPAVPGVYTRISSFIDYITEHIPTVQVRTLKVKNSSLACVGASVDTGLNINIPCLMVGDSPYEAVLNKTETEGFSWSWDKALTKSSCVQNVKKCTTVDDKLGLVVKGDTGVTGVLKFEGDAEKEQYNWRFERAFIE